MSTNLTKRRTEYTRSYSDLRGVALGNDCEAGVRRLAYVENMYKDYGSERDGVIESIPGFRKLYYFGKKINGIFIQKVWGGEDCLLIHAADTLYRFPVSEKDSTVAPSAIGTLADRKSRGFAFLGRFYILDGESLVAIGRDGSFTRIEDGINCYTPTLYVNGERHEQRNLLTNRFKEELYLQDSAEHVKATEKLKYFITDKSALTCTVVGIDSEYEGEVYIPGRVKIGNDTYTVTAIAERAFYKNSKITSVVINEGCEKIGMLAFWYAINVKSIILPDTLTEIGYGAFCDCTHLTDVYLGAGLKKIGLSAFAACVNLERVNYALNEDSFNKIENTDQLNPNEKIYGTQRTETILEVKLRSVAESVSSVTLDGVALMFEQITDVGGATGARLKVATPWEMNGKTLIIEGTLPPLYSGFGSRDESDKVEGASAIAGCTIAEIFDGRLFLSGNPSLPNTVFYSASTNTGSDAALYFGEHNYFADGASCYPVISMLAVRDSLAVFKEQDDGSGSIFYHYAEATGDNTVPKIYPVSSIHSGVCAIGDSISFLDDPLFLSPLGLSALEKQQINYDRSVVSRSRNVNFDLLKENLSEAYLEPFEDYLAVCVNGSIYLADSRAMFTDAMGIREYEWFVLRNIGTYAGDTRVYRYSTVAYPGTVLHPTMQDQICYNKYIYTKKVDDVGNVYYSPEGGAHYAVEPTDEYKGGEFRPATVFYGDGKLLLFGTENGDLCIFNNDKRGIPPERVSADPSFDAEEYRANMGNRIHPDFYHFDCHRVRYAIKTCLDDCDIPHLTKSTVKHSLVVKCKSYSTTRLCCEVGTDGDGYREVVSFGGGNLDFSDINFADMSLAVEGHATLPIGEKAKGWIEKQITLFADEFRCPIGIYSITFRYTVKGRIKRS